MSRRRLSLLIAFAVLLTLAFSSGGLSAGAATPGIASRALGPTLSVSEQLKLRRYVAAGNRAYDIGTEDGSYPAMGFHTRGEMGGIWSPPIKLLDGIWFGVGDRWVGPATRFTSGYGYVRMDLPAAGGLSLSRTDFVPDGKRAVLVGLTLSSGSSPQSVALKMDAHSELMAAYPWATTTPSQLDFNLRDTVKVDGKRLVFRETGKPPVANAPRHDWAAVVGSSLTPVAASTGRDFRGPQDPPVICPVATAPDKFRCDDTAYGKGAGGQLRYRLSLAAHSTRTVWFTVAGSDAGLAAAQAEFGDASANPEGALLAKVAQRLRLAERSQVSLPGDPLLAESLQWSKQNLADLTQEARDLEIRPTQTGTVYPPPVGHLDKIRFEGAGYPDYPWMFATDGEYTAFALVAAGQFDTIKDHLRSLRDVSLIANHGSGKVVHETVTDGSIYFGLNSDPGDTDETAKFPGAVALVWRWTGDNAFRDEMYSFSKKNLHYIFSHLDADHDLWPEGFGNVETSTLGQEPVDNTVYTLRGLRDLADMAASKGDTATVTWANTRADAMQRRFESTWYLPRIPGYADSLSDPGNTPLYQRYWTGVTPMEVELYPHGVPHPGLAARQHAIAALNLRETRCYTTEFGLYFQGLPGCDPSTIATPSALVFTLNTAIMAVAEGNYGRLGPGQQQRYTHGNQRLMLPNPDEQPGAMPEIAPTPTVGDAVGYGRSIFKPFNERAQVMQAWGNYGTLWPVVHQQLGVFPDLGVGQLEVVPQVPQGQLHIAGTNIRVGTGSVDVAADHIGNAYTTTATAVLDCRFTIGQVLPRGSTVTGVTLNGAPAAYRIRDTNRGREVLVQAAPFVSQRLTVHTG